MAFTLATYNVLDLFDPDDREKIEALASVVRALDADVLALQEIGSRAALDAVLHRADRGYGEPFVARADKRGIACAIVSRLPVLGRRALDADVLPFPVLHEGDPAPFGARLRLRRAIPVVRIDAGALGVFSLLSTHWKSGRPSPLVAPDGTEREPQTAAERAEGDLRSLVQRASEALFLRRAVDELLAAAPGESVVVAGDLNDVSGSVPVRVLAGEGEGALVDAIFRVPDAERVSVLHGGRPAAIDHVLFAGPLAKRVQSARFENTGLVDPDALPEGSRVLPSDHAPLVVRLT